MSAVCCLYVAQKCRVEKNHEIYQIIYCTKKETEKKHCHELLVTAHVDGLLAQGNV